MPLLAPHPPFRSLAFAPSEPSLAMGTSKLACVATGVAAGAWMMNGTSSLVLGALCGVGASTVGVQVLRMLAFRDRWVRMARPISMLPWGFVIHTSDQERVIPWTTVRRIDVTQKHAKLDGVATTVATDICVHTHVGVFAGSCEGEAPLDRLPIDFSSYACEQRHLLVPRIDDIRGQREHDLAKANQTESLGDSSNKRLESFAAILGGGNGDGSFFDLGPEEPNQVLTLIDTAKQVLADRTWLERVGFQVFGYRESNVYNAREAMVSVLARVLLSREERVDDPRGLAVVLAAELMLTDLRDAVVRLGQSPHPLLAALARRAAAALGASPIKVGSVDETAPFLSATDLAALLAWRPFQVG
jgi:hypothetical protein